MVLYFFIYLKLIDIINLLFVSKSLNEIVNLARIVIDTTKLNKCFIKYFDINLLLNFVGSSLLIQRYI